MPVLYPTRDNPIPTLSKPGNSGVNDVFANQINRASAHLASFVAALIVAESGWEVKVCGDNTAL